MFYGKTAGTKRKLLKAELDKKKKTIPRYEEAFNAHVEKVDKAKSAQKAIRKRNAIDTVQKGRSAVKQALGITGSITVAAASTFYLANKYRINKFVMDQFQNVVAPYFKR